MSSVPFILAVFLAAVPSPFRGLFQEPEASAPSGEVVAPDRGLKLATEEAFQGYTLFSPLSSRTSYLVDMEGRVVHRWQSQYAPGSSFYLQDDGSLLRCGRDPDNPVFEGGGQGGYLERIAWDGALMWKLDWSSEEHLHHHDVAPLPNGNVILIAWEARSRDAVIAAGRDPEHVGEDGLWPDYLVEIAPTPPEGGKVVWEWHAWDHLIQDFDPEREHFGDVTAHPELIDINVDHRDRPPLSAEERRRQAETEEQMRALGYVGEDAEEEAPAEERRGDRPRGRGADWLHTNSVHYDAAHDLLLLSSHALSEIWVIDHSTTTEQAATYAGGRYGKGGDLLYRYGNPRNYGAGSDADRVLFAQHDAHWISAGLPGEGGVLLFNNGGGRADGEYSTVDELELPFDAERGFARNEGKAFGPRELVWRYGEPEGDQRFFSSFISGAQRLPNGNTLICSGAEGRIFEVTYDFRVVWDYLNPFGGDVPMGGPGGRRRPRGVPPGAVPIGQGDPEPGQGPPGDAPGGPGDPGAGPRRFGPGGPGDIARGLFRATRIAIDHPGLSGRALEPEK